MSFWCIYAGSFGDGGTHPQGLLGASKAWQWPWDTADPADIADLNTSPDCQGHINCVQGGCKQAEYPSCYDAAQVRILWGINDARQATRKVEDEAHDVVVQIEESANEERPWVRPHGREENDEADDGKGKRRHHEEHHPGHLVRPNQQRHHDQAHHHLRYFDPAIGCFQVAKVEGAQRQPLVSPGRRNGSRLLCDCYRHGSFLHADDSQGLRLSSRVSLRLEIFPRDNEIVVVGVASTSNNARDRQANQRPRATLPKLRRQ